ncbi:MAG: acetolactate synthase large subunit [Actinomycetota bacterium]|nr:acetolactate synthase large subunit [Actinomycetota bacterium]
MNGAQALLTTFVDNGLDVCFANPGTSEMHFVAALDGVPAMRAVLALFEGVATGAADGYARMADKPAAVLLHLGPGLGNGLANLHNARRAHVPMVVVVGDHATYHKRLDAPLESDIDAVAQTVSGWVHRTMATADVGADAAAAVRAGRRGEIATLILPADVSWGDGGTPGSVSPAPQPQPDADAVRASAAALRSGDKTVILVGGDATRRAGLSAAARLARATGAELLCETFPARLERGAGVPGVQRLIYFAKFAREQLAGTTHLILAGARSPVSFFAYPDPDSPGDLVPGGCTVHPLAGPRGAATALEQLADELAAGVVAPVQPATRPDIAAGPLDAVSVAAVIGALLPEHAVIVDESNTAGAALPASTAGAPPHDVLTLTGGAIGYGMPAAVGAAIGAPGRPVLSVQADGSAMYTISALWTQAREQLDITTVVLNNGAYQILRWELANVGVPEPGSLGTRVTDLLDLGNPDLDFVRIAQGMGVPARRVHTAEELAAALRDAFGQPGPHLIEAMLVR